MSTITQPAVSFIEARALAASATIEQMYAFLKARYKHERFEGRNDERWCKNYSEIVAKSTLNQLQTHGYGMISRYESVTGERVIFDGAFREQECDWFRALVQAERLGE